MDVNAAGLLEKSHAGCSSSRSLRAAILRIYTDVRIAGGGIRIGLQSWFEVGEERPRGFRWVPC